MSATNLLTLAESYWAAREAYRAEMDKREAGLKGLAPHDAVRQDMVTMATKEEVAAREAMNEAQLALIVAAENLKPREDGPVMLPDLRLARGEKLLAEEALARTGSIRQAAQLLDISMPRMRTLMRRHQIAWPSPKGPT